MGTKSDFEKKEEDFDVTPTKRVTMATACQIFPKQIVLLKNS